MASAIRLLPIGETMFKDAMVYLSTPMSGSAFSANFNLFLNYVNTYFKNKNTSVFRLDDRTKNCAEQFHSKGMQHKFK